MVTGIAHLALTAKDMEKSLDFYIRGLGFKRAFDLPHPQTGAPWIVYLQAGKSQFVELFYNGNKDNPWDSTLRGFSHICFEVDNLAETIGRLEKEGFTLSSGLKEGSDKNLQAWIIDPDGIRIELMQISPESPQGKRMGLK
jgi:catechol 2,3-dioxygenase-like lactoylglutathione lyase family enzyme